MVKMIHGATGTQNIHGVRKKKSISTSKGVKKPSKARKTKRAAAHIR